MHPLRPGGRSPGWSGGLTDGRPRTAPRADPGGGDVRSGAAGLPSRRRRAPRQWRRCRGMGSGPRGGRRGRRLPPRAAPAALRRRSSPAGAWEGVLRRGGAGWPASPSPAARWRAGCWCWATRATGGACCCSASVRWSGTGRRGWPSVRTSSCHRAAPAHPVVWSTRGPATAGPPGRSRGGGASAASRWWSCGRARTSGAGARAVGAGPTRWRWPAVTAPRPSSAALAAEADLPYACIPSGTRNHFALDLGVDRDDVVGALDAFVDGGERLVDLAEVNGRVFVNNVSLGVYAEAVEQEGYRAAKLRTLLDTVAASRAPAAPRGSELDHPGGRRMQGAAVVMVSNNQYRLAGAAGAGTRPRRRPGPPRGDRVDPPEPAKRRRRRPWRQWVIADFAVEADRPVPAGIDGEAAELESPGRLPVPPGGAAGADRRAASRRLPVGDRTGRRTAGAAGAAAHRARSRTGATAPARAPGGTATGFLTLAPTDLDRARARLQLGRQLGGGAHDGSGHRTGHRQHGRQRLPPRHPVRPAVRDGGAPDRVAPGTGPGRGQDAADLLGRAPTSQFAAVRPLEDGVVTDLETTRLYLRSVLREAGRRPCRPPGP